MSTTPNKSAYRMAALALQIATEGDLEAAAVLLDAAAHAAANMTPTIEPRARMGNALRDVATALRAEQAAINFKQEWDANKPQRDDLNRIADEHVAAETRAGRR